MLSKEEAYLNIRPSTPPPPASPPHDAPEEMRVGAERSHLSERLNGEFSIGTCCACKETRLNANYRRGRDDRNIYFSVATNKITGVFTKRNIAIPTWRASDGVVRYDVPSALAVLALKEQLLIARLSVTVTIRHLARGGVARAGNVATFPKPADPVAAVLPRLPFEANMVRVRSGAT